MDAWLLGALSLDRIVSGCLAVQEDNLVFIETGIASR